MQKAQMDGVTEAIIGSAIAIHRALGPGLLESAYRACLAHELTLRGLRVEQERPVPLVYRDLRVECAYRLDLIVEQSVVIEVKAVEQLLPVHKAQLLSYLKLTRSVVGLLLNFNVASMNQGIHRVVNAYPGYPGRSAPGPPTRPPRSLRSSAASALKEPSQ